MDTIIFDSLHFLLRWLHIITAIAWIGASFYFIWLDNSLTPAPENKSQQGVTGELWAFHGGGIYEVNKYKLAPPKMPAHLHWFKWEAYSTWITGALLLALFYYYQAELYLVGQQAWSNTPIKAIGTSLVFIFSGLFFYELLLRIALKFNARPLATSAFIMLFTALIAAYCWFATISFSGRAAYVHVGAMLATIMAANVLIGIMPAQRGFMRAIEHGLTPDATPMLMAKTRSVHNNYLTLPVLISMISNHYPLFYGNAHAWWILCVLMLTAAYARHFFNLRHRGIIRPQILFVATAMFVAIVVFLMQQSATPQGKHIPFQQDDSTTQTKTSSDTSSHARLLALSADHCQSCHSVTPQNPAFSAPPLGLTLDSIDEIKLAKEKIITAVSSHYMPLGNITKMSDSERQSFIREVQSLEN